MYFFITQDLASLLCGHVPKSWKDIFNIRSKDGNCNNVDCADEAEPLPVSEWICRLYRVVDGLSSHANRTVEKTNLYDAYVWSNLQMLIESFMIRYARKEWVDVATLSFEAEFVEPKEIIQDISSIYLKGK